MSAFDCLPDMIAAYVTSSRSGGPDIRFLGKADVRPKRTFSHSQTLALMDVNSASNSGRFDEELAWMVALNTPLTRSVGLPTLGLFEGARPHCGCALYVTA